MEATPSLDRLALWVRVAELGSFTAVAEEVGLQRSSVSRQVSALEEELGVALLSRSTRRVQPTSAGQQLLDDVAPLVRRLHESLREVPERDDEPAGELRVTAPPDFGLWLLPGVLARLTQAHPRLQVRLDLSNRRVDLEAEGFDAALRVAMTRMPSSSLRARRLGAIEVVLVGAPGYLARKGRPRSMDDLAHHTMMLPNTDVRGFGVAVGQAVRTDHMVLIQELAQQGVGLAMLPRFLVSEAVHRGDLEQLLPDEALAAGELYLMLPSYRLPAKTRAFADAVVGYLEERPIASLALER